jgi:hypothetical protein
MRFAALALSAAGLTALASLTGCSSPVPATPDGAWEVNLSSAGGACDIMVNTTSVGEVNDGAISQRITDGVGGADISCTVAGTGPFDVDALASQNGDTLQINVAALAAGTTKAAPVLGTISYESAATAVPFTGTCNFYFANPAESVAAGKVWVAFACPEIGDAESGTMCPVTESYALFENCLTVAGM